MLSVKIFENLMNQALAFDPNSARLLKKLQGKIVQINIDTPKQIFGFSMHFIEKEITFSTSKDISPNVIMRGPLKAFLTLALTKNPHKAMRLDLALEGDTEILETMQTLFFALEIDWEEYLSQWTGDIIAHQLGNWGRWIKRRQQTLYQSTKENIAEYLIEELKVLPSQPESNEFLNEVDRLRADIERLSLKVQRLYSADIQTFI